MYGNQPSLKGELIVGNTDRGWFFLFEFIGLLKE